MIAIFKYPCDRWTLWSQNYYWMKSVAEASKENTKSGSYKYLRKILGKWETVKIFFTMFKISLLVQEEYKVYSEKERIKTVTFLHIYIAVPPKITI